MKHQMEEAIQERLLSLNRSFYITVAAHFDQTRQGWTPGLARLLQWVPPVPADRPLRVADVGCGNGRLAALLDTLGQPVEYTGVDGNATLLARAQDRAASLRHTRLHLIQADIARPDWTASLASSPGFDLVCCLATLQHMPGYNLRQRVMRDLARLTAPTGRLVVSSWQFLASDRLVARQLAWEQVGLTAADVETGDALLPWRQGALAVRYVHQIDAAEMECLAQDAGLVMVDHFRSDGKEGNLNLYALLVHRNAGHGGPANTPHTGTQSSAERP